MPVLTRTPPTMQTIEGERILRCSASTSAFLPAEQMSAYLIAIFDFVALGIAATSGAVQFGITQIELPKTRRLGGELTSKKNVPCAFVNSDINRWTMTPPYTALSLLRTDFIAVKTVSYQNPFLAELRAMLSGQKLSSLTAFLSYWNIAGSVRQMAKEKARSATLERQLNEVLVEETIAHRMLLVENTEMDVAIKQEQLKRLEQETHAARLDNARKVIEIQKALREEGHIVPLWTEENACEFLDNVRALASLGLVDRIKLEVEIVDPSEGDEVRG